MLVNSPRPIVASGIIVIIMHDQNIILENIGRNDNVPQPSYGIFKDTRHPLFS